MRSLIALLLLIAGCSDPPAGRERAGVVSLDFCSDLFVLQFVEREEIVALSPDARSDFAYLRAKSEGFPSIRTETEAVLQSGAAVVVRSYGGDPRMLEFLKGRGIKIVEIGYPQTLEDIQANTDRIAAELGSAGFATKLPAPVRIRNNTALYLTPSGTTTGPGSLIDELLRRAGYTNYETRGGWHTLPLEELVRSRPDHLALGFFDSQHQYEGWWGTMRHPLATDLLKDVPSTDLSGSLLACPAWPIYEALEQLRGEQE